ncbi:MAG: hypothetical protein UR98_C0022G0006 [Parcubacteria group bacterium GW2011_GWA1_36_12]|nr:MAG: hypothetical protein UR98_C0022G0006 [Parcubacteria group bacterium GW2011_GWA1_36_12]
MPEEKTGGSKSSWIILVVVGAVFLLAVAGFFTWRYYQAKKVDDLANQIMANPSAFKNGTSPNTSTKTNGKIDQNLVGTWESDCLVPDPGSKWAEKHKYVINSDGTAIHTRQDWEMNDCTSVQPTGLITDQIKLSIPSAGKIDQTIVSEENSRSNPNAPASGMVMYDIYQVSGSTLEFGWGFRDDVPYDGKTGSSDGDRFTTLNSYIVYNKK